jgi:hypothetical protein
VEHCGSETSNSFICSKFSGFVPEALETMLFQNGYLALRSPASSDLCLKLKISVMYHSRRGLGTSGLLQVALHYYQSLRKPMFFCCFLRIRCRDIYLFSRYHATDNAIMSQYAHIFTFRTIRRLNFLWFFKQIYLLFRL